MKASKQTSGKCPTCQKHYTYLTKDYYEESVTLSCPYCNNIVEETIYGKRES